MMSPVGFGGRLNQRLGEILIERGLIDERRLRAALSEAALWGQRLGEVLVARGDCPADAVLDALSDQLDVPVARLCAHPQLEPSLIAQVPADEARRRKVLPLGHDRDGALIVAMADPRDPVLLAAVATLTGEAISARLALASQIDAAIDRLYFDGSPPPSDGQFRRLATPARGVARPGRRTSVNRSATPPRGLPALTPARGMPATLTPSRGFPAGEPGHTPARGFTVEGAPSRGRKTLDDPGRSGERRGSEAVAALRAEVELLRRQLQRAYDALRETNVAHRVLLEQLRDGGALDIEAYTKAVQIQLERLRRP